MTWSLAFVRNPQRIASLQQMRWEWPRWDGENRLVIRSLRSDELASGITSPPRPPEEVRTVLAGARFEGAPGQEAEAAAAWASELNLYFCRGLTSIPPEVTYADGVYTVIGFIKTTHPGDHPDADGIAWFT